MSMGRAECPLSPPTITHCKSPLASHALRSTWPKSGSAETNLVGAGSRAKTVIRGAYFWLSTEVPIHTFEGHTSSKAALLFSHQATARPGRFVST